MIAPNPLGRMVRIAPIGSALAAANDGPGISPASELSALLPVIPAASVPAHEAPSLDAAPSIGVPYAQHGVSAEEPAAEPEETGEAAMAAGD